MVYHLKFRDPDVSGNFDKGDVFGFCKDDSGTPRIQLLDNKNGKEAFMAGVISRSAYPEATPPMNEDVFLIPFVRVYCLFSYTL